MITDILIIIIIALLGDKIESPLREVFDKLKKNIKLVSEFELKEVESEEEYGDDIEVQEQMAMSNPILQKALKEDWRFNGKWISKSVIGFGLNIW